MMDHDQLFKTLLKLFFADLLKITVPAVARGLDLERAKFLEQESFSDVPAGQKVLFDLVAEVPLLEVDAQIDAAVMLVEVEGDFRRASENRFWRYYAHARLKHDRPVLLVVVWLHGGPAGISPYQVVDELLGLEIHRFTFIGFGLSGSPAEQFLARDEPLAWALAALMRFKTRDRVEQKHACLEAIAHAELDDVQRFLLLDTVETYLQLSEEEAERLAERLASQTEDEEVKAMALTWASKIEAEAFERGQQQGVQKGKEQGLRQGLERGRAQGQLQLLQRLLEQRFGPLPEGVRERLAAIRDLSAVDRLIRQLFEARSLAELGLAS